MPTLRGQLSNFLASANFEVRNLLGSSLRFGSMRPRAAEITPYLLVIIRASLVFDKRAKLFCIPDGLYELRTGDSQ